MLSRNANEVNPTTTPDEFIDRRMGAGDAPGGRERRQFASSHRGLSDDAYELATAIDSYKLQHRRRYLTFEEMLHVIHDLGYSKS